MLQRLTKGKTGLFGPVHIPSYVSYHIEVDGTPDRGTECCGVCEDCLVHLVQAIDANISDQVWFPVKRKLNSTVSFCYKRQ